MTGAARDPRLTATSREARHREPDAGAPEPVERRRPRLDDLAQPAQHRRLVLELDREGGLEPDGPLRQRRHEERRVIAEPMKRRDELLDRRAPRRDAQRFLLLIERGHRGSRQ